MKCRLLLYLLLFVLSQPCLGQDAIPEHKGYWVHDLAEVLSPRTINELEGMLSAERDSTSNQIAILTVPHLEDDIDEYAVRVFEKWKLGEAEKDNGVLLVIIPDDRKLRIEVGVGLEAILTDAIASRIIRHEIAPFFKRGNYDSGTKGGVMAIIRAVGGTYKSDHKNYEAVGVAPFILVIIILIIFSISSGRKGGRRGGRHTSGRSTAPWMAFGGSTGTWGGGGSVFGGGGMSAGGGASGSW